MRVPAFRNLRAALLAGAVMLALTALSVAAVWNMQRERAANQFEFRVAEITEKIRTRMRSYEQVLRGGVALFAASDAVDRRDWRRYVERLALAEHYPGFQGVGYAVSVPAADLPAHVAAIRGSGFPDYTVYPGGPRPVYTAIVYLEPFDWRNQRAFGYDMFTDPTRRAAMERARDTGDAAMSGRVTLVQETGEDVQAGFLLYLPVYLAGRPTGTVDERRAALRGYVYSPFRMNDLLQGILGSEPEAIELEIHDGASIDDASPMYRSSPTAVAGARLSRAATIDIGGHSWLLRFSAAEGFGGDRFERQRPRLALLAGLLFSVLVAVAVWALVSRRRRGVEFAQVIGSALDAIVMIDGNDTIIEFNPAAEALFGYRRDEALGSRMADLIVPPHLRERHLRGLHARTRSGHSRIAGRSLETTAMHRDGSTFPAEVAVTRIGSEDPPVFSGFVRDISERKDQERHLRRLVDERTHEVEAFSYSVSHDLRGPLRAIDGFGAELQRRSGAQLDEAGRHYLQRIRAGAARMGQLIDDLLALSRITRLEMRESATDLSAVALEVLEHLAHERPERQVATEVRPTPPATADPRLMRVVLENLLGNAWKFSAGSADARIVFGSETVDGETAWFVRDTGAGFDQRFAERLFEPFQRLHSEREFPGTGIGLATVQRVIARHGGRVWAEGEVGSGATFWFTIGDA